jgi:DNA-3-methyladenine glycosylase II
VSERQIKRGAGIQSRATSSENPVARLTKAQRALSEGDPVLGALIEEIGPLSVAERERRRSTRPPQEAFGALVRAIVGQQLSTKAARTIHGRLVEVFGGKTPTAQQLAAASEQDLRAAGLSGRKVSYLRDLAAHVLDGTLELGRLGELGDEEVIEEIVAVRGLGRWSAEMFLIFYLKRPDVISGGDLGIRRAVQLAYGLESMPSPDEVVERAERWRPHRSLASLYLWESLAAVPVD